jgi:hypothetical protein
MTAIAGSLERRDQGIWVGLPHAGQTSMSDVDGQLTLAERYVAEARRTVARQRVRIIKLKALGRATLDHELTFQAFVSTLALLERRARELAETAKRLEHPRWLLS